MLLWSLSVWSCVNCTFASFNRLWSHAEVWDMYICTHLHIYLAFHIYGPRHVVYVCECHQHHPRALYTHSAIQTKQYWHLCIYITRNDCIHCFLLLSFWCRSCVPGVPRWDKESLAAQWDHQFGYSAGAFRSSFPRKAHNGISGLPKA